MFHHSVAFSLIVITAQGHKCGHMFYKKNTCITWVVWMKKESHCVTALQDFTRRWYVVHTLRTDNARTEIETKD